MSNVKDPGEAALLAEVLGGLRARKRPKKKNRTLLLAEENYLTFSKLCKEEGFHPSGVIDEFIAIYVKHKASGGNSKF